MFLAAVVAPLSIEEENLSPRPNLLGSQPSPFQDGDRTSMDWKIVNLSNGKSIDFSALLPGMIKKYGFYEGHGTSPSRSEGNFRGVRFLKKILRSNETGAKSATQNASFALLRVLEDIAGLDEEGDLSKNSPPSIKTLDDWGRR